MKRRVFLYVLLGLMLGCSEPEPENPSNREPVEPVKPVRDSVFKTQTEAIGKAKAAEKVLEEAAAKQRQTIEDLDR